MKIKKCFIVFILASCIIQCNAQNRAHDSIIKMLESNIHDTIKCIRLYNYIESGLEETVWPIYNDKLLFLTEQAIKKSKGRLKVIYLKYNALAISNKGYQYINLGDYTKAKKYYLIALEIQKNNNLIKEMGSTYINLGFLSNKEGNTVLALNYYHSALNIFLKINDINQAAVAYNNLAFIFGIENEFTQALKYYQNAFKMHSWGQKFMIKPVETLL